MAEWRLIETGDRYENGDVEYLLERDQRCVKIGNSDECYGVLIERMQRRDTLVEQNVGCPLKRMSYGYVMAQDAATEAFLSGDDDECDRITREIGW